MRVLEPEAVRTRYLAPGTLTWLRIKWLGLGALLGAGGMASLAMYAAAIRPAELPYRSAEPTHQAQPTGEAAPQLPKLDLGPCLPGKDCTAVEADIVRSIPEPGAIALVGIGGAALYLTRRKS